MDQVTQQNAALVEQTAAAAGSLQEQAGNLTRVVSVFKLDHRQGIDGTATRAPSVQRAGQPVVTRVATITRTVARRPLAVGAQINNDWEEF